MVDEEKESLPNEDSSGESDADPIIERFVEPADHDHEKAWWQSKKFFAFLVCEVGFFALMGAMIYEQEMNKLGENVAFMVLAVTAGILSCSYIGGQALVDKYVRAAAITMGRNPPEGEK